MTTICGTRLLALVLFSSCTFAGPSVWEELDIVPMPKEIRLTRVNRPLAGAAIVLMPGACKQARIGAEWINAALAKRGARPLPIGTAAPEGRTPIVVATRPNTAPAHERGYCIKPSKERIELLGRDAIGTLYACVTFAELLAKQDGRVVWREAVVRDWPDYILCPLSGSRAGSSTIPEIHDLVSKARNGASSLTFRKRYLAALQAHYDRLLRWKVGYLQYSFYFKWMQRTPPASQALIREAIEYGKDRGIGAMIYAEHPFVALVSKHPEVGRPCLPAGRYPVWIRCWSMDKLRRETAADLAAMVQALGITDVGFHDTDTGGFENPTRWNERCERCRQRWGDDYVSAVVHKHRIYYDALKRAAPDVRVHFTFYPYGIYVLVHDACVRALTAKYGGGPAVEERARQLTAKYETFWRRLSKEIPQDATFCIRETTPDVVQRFREIIGPKRGVFIWYGFPGKTWKPFLSEGPRWAGTFYASPRDVMYSQPRGEVFAPLQGLAVREYSWNTRAPGASGWAGRPGAEQVAHGEPQGDIFRLVYPHVIRNLFGREAAPAITTALMQNMDPWQIFERIRGNDANVLTNSKRVAEQAAMAERGARALDELWAKRQATGGQLGMDDFAFRRFVYLREVYHSCTWWAKARAANMRARERAKAQDVAGAEAEIARGLALVEQAKADFAKLAAERPDDPILQTRGRNKWADGWRAFMPGWDVDMAPLVKRLKQTRKELKELGSLGAAPKEIVELLDNRRLLRAVRTASKIALDGRLNEAAWARAYPIESFFVHQRGVAVARAHTRARLLYDDANLYVGFTCWSPGDEPAASDGVEVFLMPPDLRGDYVHFMVDSTGKVRHQRCRLEPRGEVKFWRKDYEWRCEGLEAKAATQGARWELEMRIPIASLGATQARSRWYANLCRSCATAGGEAENSSTQPQTAADFHDVKGFRQIVWAGKQGYEPSATIEVAGMKTAVRTLDDRIATVADLRVDVQASQVLHNVVLAAEAYGPKGKLQARKDLLRSRRVFYRWRPEEQRSVAFEEQCAAGGIRLVLRSDEGEWQRWVRFGGWVGAPKVGSVFAPGDAARPSPSLRGAAYFPAAVVVERGKEPARLFRSRTGTVEFWLKPSWPGDWPPPGQKSEYRQARRAFLHFGVMRRQHPRNTNQSSLSLIHMDAYGSMVASITSRNYVNWSCAFKVHGAGWRVGVWRHVAVVWDADAAPADWLRVYVDGKRASGPCRVSKPERLGEDKSVRLEADSPYVVQVGSLNTGRCPAQACIDDLRISRTPRYVADFDPPRRGLAVDRDTSALFRFDDTLVGEGVTEAGKRYQVEARAGVLEYH